MPADDMSRANVTGKYHKFPDIVKWQINDETRLMINTRIQSTMYTFDEAKRSRLGGREAETNQSVLSATVTVTVTAMTSINLSKTGQSACQQSAGLENPVMIATTRLMKCTAPLLNADQDSFKRQRQRPGGSRDSRNYGRSVNRSSPSV
ncbi:hypothetical protein SNK03_13564 [Fusarium graminearum]